MESCLSVYLEFGGLSNEHTDNVVLVWVLVPMHALLVVEWT